MTEYQNPRYAIFHNPRPVSSEGTSASQIRPYLMYKALQEIGSQIDLVAGYTKERNEAVRKKKKDNRWLLVRIFVFRILNMPHLTD